MSERALVVGSGAGGSVAAWVLVNAGYDVLVLERGPRRLTARGGALLTPYPGDHEARERGWEMSDPIGEARTLVQPDGSPDLVGAVNPLASLVGGTTVHWDAKTPRFWDLDFRRRSTFGVEDCADIIDWPFSYEDLQPYYETVEQDLGVSGDVATFPAANTRLHAPRRGPLPHPAGPGQQSSLLLASAAEALGLHPFAVPMAARPAQQGEATPGCFDCGSCCGFSCPNGARGSALNYLAQVEAAGGEVRELATVQRLVVRNRRVVAVTYIDPSGRPQTESADLVVLAASAIDSCRIALLSGLVDRSGMVGRGIMFHSCTVAYGLFPEPVFDGRGRNITHVVDDFADPDYPGAAEVAGQHGLKVLRGGTTELGHAPFQGLTAARVVFRLVESLRRSGRTKLPTVWDLLASGVMERRLIGVMMHGEDLPQPCNRVTLHPRETDWAGTPVPRIHYTYHRHELAAATFYGPIMEAILRRAGCAASLWTPEYRSAGRSRHGGPVPTDSHNLGGLRMHDDPRVGVTDGLGRWHAYDNLFVADGSLFATSGGHNPTLTIMATALRNLSLAVGSSMHRSGGHT